MYENYIVSLRNERYLRRIISPPHLDTYHMYEYIVYYATGRYIAICEHNISSRTVSHHFLIYVNTPWVSECYNCHGSCTMNALWVHKSALLDMQHGIHRNVLHRNKIPKSGVPQNCIKSAYIHYACWLLHIQYSIIYNISIIHINTYIMSFGFLHIFHLVELQVSEMLLLFYHYLYMFASTYIWKFRARFFRLCLFIC